MPKGGVAAAIVVGCCVLVGAVVAVAAVGGSTRSLSFCVRASTGAEDRGPQLLHEAPPAPLTSTVGVLAEPAPSTERLPAARVPSGLSAVWIDYARPVDQLKDGTRVYLIPGRVIFPQACIEAASSSERPALEAEVRAQNGGTVSIDVVVGERQIDHLGYTLADVASGEAILLLGPLHYPQSLMAGVVPDGVASVRVARVPHAPVVAPVAKNFFFAALEGEPHGSFVIESLGGNGASIRSTEITNPTHFEPVGEGGPVGLAVGVPSAVRRAGARKVAEFKSGRLVTAQSGCLDCHRIGYEGNAGPGKSLTGIGAKLPKRVIERALVDPSMPMPSFRNLPSSKFRALVYFLSQLRERG
jgi:hypothetical protein